jgi:pimeloyl-ACP methyl ester carboxylesterase
MNERTVETSSGSTRVWEKGSGTPLGFFAGLGGLPRWLPVLDALAGARKVVVPSLPGYPGGSAYEHLDDHLDWILAAIDTYRAAGLWGGDLIGCSVGGALAAEVAALWPDAVRRLVLIAPFGLFDPAEPGTDIFAQRNPEAQIALLSAKPEAYGAYVAAAKGNDVDGALTLLRADMAASRVLWPLGDTRVAKRLPRIRQKTLVLWGAEDKVIPPAHAERFAELISGPVQVEYIAGAGHKVEFDAPDAVASAIDDFLS